MDTSVSGLTEDQIDRYWNDGYLSGLTILTEEQMRIAREKLLLLEQKEIQNNPEQWADSKYLPWSDRKSLWWHWFKPMATHPTILASVKSILGPNLLIRNADIFVKPAQTEQSINWHVDCTASTEDAGKMLSAWFAISESDPDNGCMEFLQGSHRRPLPSNIKDKNSLSYTGNALARADLSERRSNVLRPGQMSLHHFRTVHRSSGNTTNHARIGFVIRFMAADANKNAAETGKGFMVGGDNSPGHFHIEKNFPVTWKRSAQGELQSLPKDDSID